MSQGSEWCRVLVDAKQVVLHVPTGVVGHVVEVRAMETSPGAEVLVLSTGDSFLAEGGSFVNLTDAEARFSGTLSKVLGKVVVDGVALAAAMGVPPKSTRALALAALQRLLRELQRPGA